MAVPGVACTWETVLSIHESRGADIQSFLLTADIASIVFTPYGIKLKSILFELLSKFSDDPAVQTRCLQLLQDYQLLSPQKITDYDILSRYDALLRSLHRWLALPEVVVPLLQLLSMLCDLPHLKKRAVLVEDGQLIYFVKRAMGLHVKSILVQRAALQLLDAVMENTHEKRYLRSVTSSVFKSVLDNLRANDSDLSIAFSSMSIMLTLMNHAKEFVDPWTDQLIAMSMSLIGKHSSAELICKCLTMMYVIISSEGDNALFPVTNHPRGIMIFVDALHCLNGNQLKAAIIDLELIWKLMRNGESVSLVAFRNTSGVPLVQYALTFASELKYAFDGFLKLLSHNTNEFDEELQYLFVLHCNIEESIKLVLCSGQQNGTSTSTSSIVVSSSQPPIQPKGMPSIGMSAAVQQQFFQRSEPAEHLLQLPSGQHHELLPQQRSASFHPQAPIGALVPALAIPSDSIARTPSVGISKIALIKANAALKLSSVSKNFDSPRMEVAREVQPMQLKLRQLAEGQSVETLAAKLGRTGPQKSTVGRKKSLRHLNVFEANSESHSSNANESGADERQLEEMRVALRFSQLQQRQSNKRCDTFQSWLRSSASAMNKLVEENENLAHQLGLQQASVSSMAKRIHELEEQNRLLTATKDTTANMFSNPEPSDNDGRPSAVRHLVSAIEKKVESSKPQDVVLSPLGARRAEMVSQKSTLSATESVAEFRVVSKCSHAVAEASPTLANMGIIDGLEFIQAMKSKHVAGDEDEDEDEETPSVEAGNGIDLDSAHVLNYLDEIEEFGTDLQTVFQVIIDTYYLQDTQELVNGNVPLQETTTKHHHRVASSTAIRKNVGLISVKRLRTLVEKIGLVDGRKVNRRYVDFIVSYLKTSLFSVYGLAFVCVYLGTKKFPTCTGIDLLRSIQDLVRSYLSDVHSDRLTWKRDSSRPSSLSKEWANSMSSALVGVEVRNALSPKTISELIRHVCINVESLLTIFKCYASHFAVLSPDEDEDSLRYSQQPLVAAIQKSIPLAERITGLRFADVMDFARDLNICPQLVTRLHLHDMFFRIAVTEVNELIVSELDTDDRTNCAFRKIPLAPFSFYLDKKTPTRVTHTSAAPSAWGELDDIINVIVPDDDDAGYSSDEATGSSCQENLYVRRSQTVSTGGASAVSGHRYQRDSREDLLSALQLEIDEFSVTCDRQSFFDSEPSDALPVSDETDAEAEAEADTVEISFAQFLELIIQLTLESVILKQSMNFIDRLQDLFHCMNTQSSRNSLTKRFAGRLQCNALPPSAPVNITFNQVDVFGDDELVLSQLEMIVVHKLSRLKQEALFSFSDGSVPSPQAVKPVFRSPTSLTPASSPPRSDALRVDSSDSFSKSPSATSSGFFSSFLSK